MWLWEARDRDSVHNRAHSSNFTFRPQLHSHAAHFEHGCGEALKEYRSVVCVFRYVPSCFHVDEQWRIRSQNASAFQHRSVVVLVELVWGDGLRGDACCVVHGLWTHAAELDSVSFREERIIPSCAVKAEESPCDLRTMNPSKSVCPRQCGHVTGSQAHRSELYDQRLGSRLGGRQHASCLISSGDATVSSPELHRPRRASCLIMDS